MKLTAAPDILAWASTPPRAILKRANTALTADRVVGGD